ncbi:SGNH/GDSL hydrolase family protein [Cryobacterium sp. AP23]
MANYRHISALGSSFAAGPGLAPFEDQAAMRSTRNYAHLLAEDLGAELTDLTVSGATTATILDVPQTVLSVEFPPQILGVPADADVVTITAGGNDLQYAGSMLYTAWKRMDPQGPIATMMQPGFAEGIPLPSVADIELTADGLARIVEAARARATSARVILVDYLTVLDANTPDSIGSPFTAHERAAFLRIQSALGRAYTLAAERTGAELVRVSALSAGHALSSAEPWVFDFEPDMTRTAASFHPNELGMRAVAWELAAVLSD